MSIDLSSYKILYIQTAEDYVTAMKASLVVIENDTKNHKAMETMYLAGHSLKSQSLIMGYKNTASFAEFIEHTFRNVTEGNKEISEKILGEIKQALQKLEQSLINIKELDKELTLQVPQVN